MELLLFAKQLRFSTKKRWKFFNFWRRFCCTESFTWHFYTRNAPGFAVFVKSEDSIFWETCFLPDLSKATKFKDMKIKIVPECSNVIEFRFGEMMYTKIISFFLCWWCMFYAFFECQILNIFNKQM